MRELRSHGRLHSRPDGPPPRMTVSALAAFAAMSLAAAPPDAAFSRPAATAAGRDRDDPRLAGRFAGKVITFDAKPISGTRVYVVPATSNDGTPGPVRARTGADGRFAFEAPGKGRMGRDAGVGRRRGLGDEPGAPAHA